MRTTLVFVMTIFETRNLRVQASTCCNARNTLEESSASVIELRRHQRQGFSYSENVRQLFQISVVSSRNETSPENSRNFAKFPVQRRSHENCICDEMTLAILDIPSGLSSIRDDVHETLTGRWKLKIEETALEMKES